MEFLKEFTKRMQMVGRYALLVDNSRQKTTWKKFGVETLDEQMNMIFTILLYVMEMSLKEEPCTIDHIAGFVGEVNDSFYKRSYSYEDEKLLADFVVNEVLSNSGTVMYFKGYDYENKEYRDIHIQYIANEVVYLEKGVRRTSYYLTDDGYNMVLATMELENNLKLTVHEMLFKLHLEKADYGRAVNDIKTIFDQLRIQNQKIQEAMRRIRQNALSYSVDEYRQIVEENIHTVEDTREKFKLHKIMVEKRVKEYEEQEIDLHALSKEDEEKLENLKVIESYLNRSLDEHQKILNEHFDLKSLYDRELENYTNMTMVKRYHFRTELYDKILENSSMLEHMDEFLKPLFRKQNEKIYNPNKAFEMQKRLRKKEEEDSPIELLLEEEAYRKEQEEKRKERLEKYEKSLELILQKILEKKQILLSDLKEELNEQELEILIPSMEIFREILIEFLSAQVIDVELIRKERREVLLQESIEFRLKEMLPDILEKKKWNQIKKLYAVRSQEDVRVCFEQIKNEAGEEKTIRCSDIKFWYE